MKIYSPIVLEGMNDRETQNPIGGALTGQRQDTLNNKIKYYWITIQNVSPH